MAETVATRDTRVVAQARTEGEIDTAAEGLDIATRARFYQGLNIGTLTTCLSGWPRP